MEICLKLFIDPLNSPRKQADCLYGPIWAFPNRLLYAALSSHNSSRYKYPYPVQSLELLTKPCHCTLLNLKPNSSQFTSTDQLSSSCSPASLMGTPPWSLQQKQKQGFQFENPFSLKVAQIFTGVGVGCGVGIGIGNPIYFGAIPALQQVMVATRGATDIFSGVGRHVNASMKKLGLTNVQAGVGCGVGIGHGFGVGLALKPGVVRGIQSSFEELVAKIMAKMKDVPGLSSSQSTIQGDAQEQGTPPSMNAIKSTTSVVKDSTGMSYEKRTGVISELTGSRTDKVISGFLQNPLIQPERAAGPREMTGNLRSENNMLQMLLKHQQVIEELREENEKLREILTEDLKVSPHRLRGYSKNKKSSYAYETPCSDCFECRRRTRKAPR